MYTIKLTLSEYNTFESWNREEYFGEYCLLEQAREAYNRFIIFADWWQQRSFASNKQRDALVPPSCVVQDNYRRFHIVFPDGSTYHPSWQNWGESLQKIEVILHEAALPSKEY